VKLQQVFCQTPDARGSAQLQELTLHDHQVFARSPAFAQPKGATDGVVGVEKNAAFRDAVPAETRERFVDQPAAKAPSAVRGNHGQVVEVSAPAVMPAQHGADDDAFCVQRNEAQTGIARQKGGDRLPRIGFVQTDAFARAPQRQDSVVVGQREFAQTIGGRRRRRERGNEEEGIEGMRERGRMLATG